MYCVLQLCMFYLLNTFQVVFFVAHFTSNIIPSLHQTHAIIHILGIISKTKKSICSIGEHHCMDLQLTNTVHVII